MKEADHYWRIWNGTTVKVNIQVEWRDAWVGLFWRSTEYCLHLYVCPIPFLPIHVTILKRPYRDTEKRETP